MNYLFFSDLHIDSKSLSECKDVLDEILALCKEYKITHLFDLGDTFDNIKPNSLALDLFSDFIKSFNKEIIILAAQSHESETPEDSVINHFGILNEMVTVVKEYKDDAYLYCGHFIVNESKKNYGGTIGKKDLKYKYVILGHGHDYEIIPPQIVQLGSCRFIDFGEHENNQKRVAICLGYQEHDEQWIFPVLKSVIPMKTFELCKIDKKQGIANDLKAKKTPETGKENTFSAQIKALSEQLDTLAPKTKVRIIFKDYELWRAFLNVEEKYKEKFVLYREKKDFIISDFAVASAKNQMTLKDNLTKWLNQNSIDEKIKQILLEEII